MKETVFGFVVVFALMVAAGAAYRELAARAAAEPAPPEGFDFTPVVPVRFDAQQAWDRQAPDLGPLPR